MLPSNALHFQLNSFFLTAEDNMLIQKTQNSRFLESLPFSKILLVVKAEEEVIEIPYKIITITLNIYISNLCKVIRISS